MKQSVRRPGLQLCLSFCFTAAAAALFSHAPGLAGFIPPGNLVPSPLGHGFAACFVQNSHRSASSPSYPFSHAHGLAGDFIPPGNLVPSPLGHGFAACFVQNSRSSASSPGAVFSSAPGSLLMNIIYQNREKGKMNLGGRVLDC